MLPASASVQREVWYMSLGLAEPSTGGGGSVPGADQHGKSTPGACQDNDAAAELGLAEFPVRRWPEQRVVVLASAMLLLIGAFAVSMFSESALDELAVLYAVPVMLTGLELGVVGGAIAAALAGGLLLAASGRQSELEPLGLAASSLVFLIAGVLGGRFSERMRAARHRQERLLTSGLRLARLEDLDSLPRVLAAEVTQALDLASVQVQLPGAAGVDLGTSAGETLRVPITAHDIVLGSLTLGSSAGRSFTPEDRVVAAKLALQAGVAFENQRLLASERERAALHAELAHTRRRLQSHLRDVSQILDSHEAERREIAGRLHEQAAQAMAGVLFGLQVLEHDLDQELTRKQLEELTEVARGTLADLRQLAVSVRPPSLDDLGLRTALEGMAERESARGTRQITLHCGDCQDDLAAEVETCAYRVTEDAILALDGPVTVELNVDRNREGMRIELGGHAVDQRKQMLTKLAAARARLELVGGTLRTTSETTGRTTIVAELPLRRTPNAQSPR